MSHTNVSSMFNTPLTKRLFNVLAAAFRKNRDYELSKAMHVPPEKALSLAGPRFPLLSSDSIVLGWTDHSSGGLKRVKTINRNPGKAIRKRRREEKEDLAMAFFIKAF
jgi:hypothetical protein